MVAVSNAKLGPEKRQGLHQFTVCLYLGAARFIYSFVLGESQATLRIIHISMGTIYWKDVALVESIQRQATRIVWG